MRTRLGFARLLPLMALTGLAAGTLALLASAQAVQAPAPSPPRLTVAAPRPARAPGQPPPRFTLFSPASIDRIVLELETEPRLGLPISLQEVGSRRRSGETMADINSRPQEREREGG